MGAVVNSVVVLVGSLVGLFMGQRIPERINKALMQGIALVVLSIGITGILQGGDSMIMILSMVVGILIGEGIDFNAYVNRFVEWLSAKFERGGTQSTFSQGFLSASMLFCIGSMAIVGSLESGLLGDNSTLYTKSVLDGISAILLSSTLGIGVAFSSVPLFIYQGGLILFAPFLAPFLKDAVIIEMTTIGSLLLIAMGLNMLDITDIKVMNFVPAVFLPILFMAIF